LEGLSLKKKRLLALLVISIIVLALSSYYLYVWLPITQPRTNIYQNVTIEQAKELIETTSGLVILDVRTYSEFNSGYIKNAICIPVDVLQQNLNKLDPQSNILVYCASGDESDQAAKILVDNGFQHIYNLLGGIEAWKQSGNTVEWCHCQPHIILGNYSTWKF